MPNNTFKVGFDILDYVDILPSFKGYENGEDGLDGDVLINSENYNEDECVWHFEEPLIITQDYIRQEVKRVLKTGVWIIIKSMQVWIPPNYYFFLRYFRTGGERPEFRLNRLMSIYETIRVRKNPNALGTLTVKARQIGETTMQMSDLLWEAASMDFGMLGVQSKTRQTVIESCWRTLTMGWNGIPQWLKNAIFPEFSSGDAIATTMRFVSKSTDNKQGKDVLITYAAGSHNAFDSVNNMRSIKLDEWLKWKETSPYATFLNYEKFIATGKIRKGLFSIFSSPADMETPYIKETYDFWVGSDPTKLNNLGTTSTRIFRQYTSPLTGLSGYYDKWGDADANEIYDFIMNQRKSVPKAYRMGEIRAYPLTEEEIFGSFDSGGEYWANHKGIVQRKTETLNIRFKDEITKEPSRIYGNLEWRDGIRDSDVDFRPADKENFDVIDARFCVSYFSNKKETLIKNNDGRWKIPKLPESCLGIDPIDKRHSVPNSKGFSDASMTCWKGLDYYDTGIVKCPTLFYMCRPDHADIFFEDAIRAAIFTRSMVQTESVNSKIIDYFEDRGYLDWMLSKRGESRTSKNKGDSPSGRGIFMSEMKMIIDTITNTPLNEGDPYLLEKFWFPELLSDLANFNPKETHANDATMSFGQSLMGMLKMLEKKVRERSRVNDEMIGFMLA